MTEQAVAQSELRSDGPGSPGTPCRRQWGHLTGRPVFALLLGTALVAAACSSATEPGAVAADPGATAAPTSVEDEPVQVPPTGTTVNRDAREQAPLYESRPQLEVSLDSTGVTASLPMGYQEWDGRAQEPAEPERLGSAVANAGQILTFVPAHPADLTIIMYQLGSEATFKRTMTVEGPDSEIRLPVPQPGFWLLDIAVSFGLSENYAGSGVLRYGLWLQAVAPGANCGTPPAQPSAVTDDQGCPVPTSLIRLDLNLAVPWFHCAPWPPTLRWTKHPTADTTQFLRYDFGEAKANVVDIPGDARPTGFELPAGPILVSPTDPEAVFIDRGAGTAERWIAPEEEAGCA